MLRTILSVVSVVWLTVACANDVDVGGPRDENGDGSGGEAVSDMPSDMPSEQLKSAREYADGEAACATDADCCVVVDDCQNAAYVVGASEKEATEQAIVTSYDPNRCTACIAPLVQVSCEAGKCVGAAVDFMSASDELWQQLSQTHCGSVEGPQPSSAHESVFGCGTL